jgi:hypothetical protein
VGEAESGSDISDGSANRARYNSRNCLLIDNHDEPCAVRTVAGRRIKPLGCLLVLLIAVVVYVVVLASALLMSPAKSFPPMDRPLEPG